MADVELGARRAQIERLVELINSDEEAELPDLYTDDVVVHWPQSGETVRGPGACAAVAARQPAGRPTFVLRDVFGAGDRFVATLLADYHAGRPWHVVAIVDFRGDLIARRTEYFAEAFDPPPWRADLVEVEAVS